MKNFIEQLGMTSEDVKNLSIAQVLSKMGNSTRSADSQSGLGELLKAANFLGLADQTVGSLGLFDK
jgi:hypothetical protein